MGRCIRLVLSLTYKSYWRKSGLKGKWGEIYLSRLAKYHPKHVLEVGVFCGVTAKNTCDYLRKIHGDDFSYTGIDLFGGNKKSSNNEIEPEFLKSQKFSNPLKNIYYNYIVRENLNSLKSVEKLLKKYKNNVNLIAGDTNILLNQTNLEDVDFIFLDGGHSYKTVMSDLNTLWAAKGKSKVLLCDDYGKLSHIPEVEKAINNFVKKNNLDLNVIENRFAELII